MRLAEKFDWKGLNQQYDLQAWKYSSHGKERTLRDCPQNSSFPQYYAAILFLHRSQHTKLYYKRYYSYT
jgi:hypothetical protein